MTLSRGKTTERCWRPKGRHSPRVALADKYSQRYVDSCYQGELTSPTPVAQHTETGVFRSARRALLGAVALATMAIVLAPAAPAFQDYTSYTLYWNGVLQPWDGSIAYEEFSIGYNYRTDNAGCRHNNSGQMAVSYWNTSGQRVTYSGTGWTNCNTGAYVIIENNGYYRLSCRNMGFVAWSAKCDSYNYTP